MIPGFNIPPSGFGPGSQPAGEDGEFDYLALPSGMRTYEAHLPEIADPDTVRPAIRLLKRIAGACEASAAGGPPARFALAGLDAANSALIADTFGEGEVSCRVAGDPEITAQESVFAGVWVVGSADGRWIEVAAVPVDVLERAFEPQAPALGPLAARGPGVVNAPALVSELMERSRDKNSAGGPHVVNLSLLPHTPEDLRFLDEALGRGAATLLSRGYGNCRVTATALPQVWKVQFFNSMDALILDSFEVTRIPDVAVAAPEDFADSAVRLREVLEAIR